METVSAQPMESFIAFRSFELGRTENPTPFGMPYGCVEGMNCITMGEE
jgi:hypothetical protein